MRTMTMTALRCRHLAVLLAVLEGPSLVSSWSLPAFHGRQRLGSCAFRQAPAVSLRATPDRKDGEPACLDRRTWWLWASSGALVGLSSTRAWADEGESAGNTSPGGDDISTVKLAEDFPDVSVPYKGKALPLKKFLGKATLVVNVKTDDPEAVRQYQALSLLNERYATQGLRILAFPTDQGWYEPEVSEIVRIRALQSYGFGQFPFAVVFDKVDILGSTAHPLFRYLMTHLKNPNGRASIALNFEKFLLDEHGVPVRRYPRKFTGLQIAPDIERLLNGQQPEEPSQAFLTAWTDAAREAVKSEYAFKKGYNVYQQEEPSSDWLGIEEEGFR